MKRKLPRWFLAAAWARVAPCAAAVLASAFSLLALAALVLAPARFVGAGFFFLLRRRCRLLLRGGGGHDLESQMA